MNPTTTTIDPTPPPPVPLRQPPRSSFSCDRHPAQQFTGFCPTCLCERLTTLENTSSNANTPSSSRRPSSVTAAVRNLFSGGGGGGASSKPPKPTTKQQPTSLSPTKLRRTKSFSASKNNEAALGLSSFEPQRKSCDVRGRSTLWSLFTLEKEDKKICGSTVKNVDDDEICNNVDNGGCVSGVKIESCLMNKPVFEEIDDEEEFKDAECVNDSNSLMDDVNDEIRPVIDNHLEALRSNVNSATNEIVEEDVVLNVSDLKPMKDHIDFSVREKKSSGGGFWAAASVFSKKLHKWRQKQKVKKQNNGVKLTKFPAQKPISRHCRETRSEIADYGFGRSSCDTDPRFSLDTGRISFDTDPARYSFDKPRASWDGHLATKSFPRMNPMVSLTENAPIVNVAQRSDMQIPVEEPMMRCANEDDLVPGGSVQTRDYYLDSSSSRRRKSLDRSSSIRNIAASVVAEIDELKMASNATRVSPSKADSFHGGERDVRDSNSNSLRDDCSETFELHNWFRDNNVSLVIDGERKDSKKSKSWRWRIWGFIYRRNNGGNKEVEDEDERYSKVNRVARSLSESWQDFRKDGINNGYTNIALNRNTFHRSNSSVSLRNGGSFANSIRRSVLDTNGKKKDEFVLDKNQRTRYSPNNFDNGLLRLYLTPMRSGRRGAGAIGNIRPNNSHSIARSVLRLY